MGYFTETINALHEFKGDSELAYAERRRLENWSNDHIEGQNAGKNAIRRLNSNMHTTSNEPAGSRNIRTADQYRKYTDTAQRVAKSRLDKRGPRKSCKESFSEAFDSVVL